MNPLSRWECPKLRSLVRMSTARRWPRLIKMISRGREKWPISPNPSPSLTCGIYSKKTQLGQKLRHHFVLVIYKVYKVFFSPHQNATIRRSLFHKWHIWNQDLTKKRVNKRERTRNRSKFPMLVGCVKSRCPTLQGDPSGQLAGLG